MGVVGQGIEKQIGEREAGQMVRIGQGWREDQPRGSASQARFGLATQICLGRGVRLKQP